MNYALGESTLAKYVPKPLPSTLPITLNDILAAMEQIISKYGSHGVCSPIITHDPDIDMHFGITLDWHIIINTAKLPKNIDDSQILSWIKYCTIEHEFGHYHICPFDGQTMIRLLADIKHEWKEATSDLLFLTANFFSDLIVNRFLTIHNPDLFPAMLMKWFVWIDHITQTNDLRHTMMWKIFVRVHELQWRTSVFGELPPEYEPIARIIYHDICHNVSWDTIVKYIAVTMKDIFTSETDPMNAIDEQNLSNNEDNVECGNPTQFKKEKCDRPSSVTSEGNTYPYDFMRTVGDPYDHKVLANYDAEKVSENCDELIEALQDTLGKEIGAGKFLSDLGLVQNSQEGKRLWLRVKSKHLIRYDYSILRQSGEVRDHIAEWRWNDRFHQINFFKSVLSNCAAPLLPPYAKKWVYTIGSYGRIRPHYPDLLIGVDSSSSMIGFSPKEVLSTPYDFASLAAFALLQATIIRDIKVAAVNFSDQSKVIPWTPLTYESLPTIEQLILRYRGGGTVFPSSKLEDLIKVNEHCIVVFISDTDVANPSEFLAFFSKIYRKVPAYIFHAGSTKVFHRGTLENFGVHIIPIHHIEDLPKIVLTNVGQNW